MERHCVNSLILGERRQPARGMCPSVHISLQKAVKGKDIQHSTSWEMQKYNTLRRRTGNSFRTELMTSRHSAAGRSNLQSHICILLRQLPWPESLEAHPVFHKPPYVSRPPASFAIRAEWLFKTNGPWVEWYSQAQVWGVKGWACSSSF